MPLYQTNQGCQIFYRVHQEQYQSEERLENLLGFYLFVLVPQKERHHEGKKTNPAPVTEVVILILYNLFLLNQ